MERDKVWALENEHLQTVYQELLDENKEATEILHAHHQEGISIVSEMDKDLSLDMSNYSDQIDSFAQIEIRNREIDQLNAKHDAWQRKYDASKRLLESPYFARIDVLYEEEEAPESYYLGTASFVNKKDQHRVIDWRTPIAELYYNQELGHTKYTANDVEIPVELQLRRQFKVQKNELVNLFDSSVAIEDALLLAALESNSSQYMQDITATIQKEQNEIIRDTKSSVLLVNGIAGSGKTSAVLQRIAYLLYQERNSLRSEDVVLLAPNRLFVNYISQVLPSLGEKNPTSHTLSTLLKKDLSHEFHLESEGETNRKKIQMTESKQEHTLRSRAFFEFLQSKSTQDVFSKAFFRSITRGDKEVISVDKIYEWFLKTPTDASVRARIQAVSIHMLRFFEKWIQKKALTKEFQDKILSLTEEQQEHYFGAVIEDESKKNITRLAEKYLHRHYQSSMRQMRQFLFVDLVEMLDQFYFEFSKEHLKFEEEGISQEAATVLNMLTHFFVRSIEERQVKYVLIDEVQDYSPFSYLYILTKFPRAKFTMLGDENQAIFQTNLPFDKMEEILRHLEKNVTRKDLLTSYRSNGPITRLFKKLADKKENFEVVTFRDEEEEPQQIITNTQEEFFEKLSLTLSKFPQEESVAILSKNFDHSLHFYDQMKEKFPLQFFDANTKKVPGSGVNVLAIPLAKGLEFDHILVVDATKENYQTTQDRHLLYTAISRGMKSVTIFAQGEMSELLA